MNVQAVSGAAPEREFVHKPPLAILIVIAMLGPLAMNIFLPSMLGIQRYFATDFSTVQLGLSLFLASLAVAQLILGTLSDRYGRRPVLLAGTTLFLLGTLACIFAPKIEVFLLGRVVQGFGGSAGLILGRAILRDMYDRDQAASMIGYVTMGMAVAPMVGPAIAGYLDKFFGWQSSFWLLVVFAVAVLITSYLKVSETNRNPIPSINFASVLKSYRELVSIKIFWLYSGISSFTTGMFFSFLGGAPFVSEKVLGLRPDQYGLYFVIVALGYSVGNFMSGRFASRHGVFRMIMYGNLLGIIAISVMALLFLFFDVGAWLLFGPMFFLSLANGLVLPSAMAGTVSVKPHLAGSASGLAGSIQMLFGAILSYLVGIALPLSAVPSVWPLIVAMFLSLLMALIFGGWLWSMRQ
tara:strand:- start:450 stop:1676 length:1227 start_codon:yes stop_codon:yes gene_type:complete